MIAALLLIPLVTGILAFFVRRLRFLQFLLISTAFAHAGLTVSCWLLPARGTMSPIIDGLFGLDQLGLLFLTVVSLLFLVISLYATGYLVHEHESMRTEKIFVGSMLTFLFTMTAVTVCLHFELLWVAIEATTLASAPLIYFHRTKHSLEATWKYLIVCSVGIALALLGNFAIAIAGAHSAHTSMLLKDLVANAADLQPQWIRAAFIFLFIGYGTKMGLAPMHTWLPDAHSESPSMVSALLSGALLNCAFLGILRCYQVVAASGQAPFAQELFVLFGLLSIFFAGVFILRQSDFKRMLAYSSVEHMGIQIFSIGIGGTAAFAGFLHLFGHSMAKALLFLCGGNILHSYRTKSVQHISGVKRALPFTGVFWIIGLFAILGLPPFSLFTSELLILKAILDQHSYVIAAVFLLLLLLVFIGMGSIGFRMAFGNPPDTLKNHHEALWAVLPPFILVVLLLLLGPQIPHFLEHQLNTAVYTLSGKGP